MESEFCPQISQICTDYIIAIAIGIAIKTKSRIHPLARAMMRQSQDLPTDATNFHKSGQIANFS